MDRSAGALENILVEAPCGAPVLPFPHDHSVPFFARKLQVDGEDAAYLAMVCRIALATALHLTAVALPSGLGAEGLPAGVQLVGPEHGEYCLFDVAAALEEMLGGFTPRRHFGSGPSPDGKRGRIRVRI